MMTAALAVLFALNAVGQTTDRTTTVVVDTNPALFAVLAALHAAGAPSVARTPVTGLRAQVQAQIDAQLRAHQAPVVADLKAYYASHHRSDPSQELAQYVTLALFMSNPPGLGLAVPAAGLPPDAAAVQDFPPLVQRFWTDAGLDKIWAAFQPDFQIGLNRDSAQVRQMVTSVDAFFRIPQAYSPRQYFIFPDALIPPGAADALNYQDNYYLAANLDLTPEMFQVRHTYLHFLLDPLIARYPAAVTPVEQDILPQVAHAPALDIQFKRDPELLFTECLVRAVEIQLDAPPVTSATAGPAHAAGAQSQGPQTQLDAAMKQGLVITQAWYDQLTTFRSEPENFSEFYPVAAFALRLDEVAGQVKHLAFAPAPAAVATEEPVRAPGLMEQAQSRFDAKDYAAAGQLADAALHQPTADRGAAYFLLGKVAASQNQPQAALTNFQSALTQSRPNEVHIRTWSNIFLARLYDAQNRRSDAVAHYQAALAIADTPASKALAQAGIKAPYKPSGGR